METMTIPVAEIVKDFIIFLKNGNFTLMRIRKGKSDWEKDDIILCYGASGTRTGKWGDTLLSIKIAHKDLKGSEIQSSESIKNFLVKENVGFLWASCSNKTFYIYPAEKIELSESGGTTSVAVEGELKILLSETLDMLLKPSLGRDYYIAV